MKRIFLSFLVVLGVVLAPFTAFAQTFTFGNDVIDIKDGGTGNNGYMLLDGTIQYGPTYSEEAIPGSGLESGTFQDIEAIYSGSIELFYRVGVPEASLSTPYYLNGSAIFQVSFNPVNFGNSFTVNKANLTLNPIVTDNLVVYAYNDNSNYNLIKFLVYFRNYCVTDSKTIIPIPEISFRYNMIIKNRLYVDDTGMPAPSRIQVVSTVSAYQANFGRTLSPDNNIGDSAIIHDAVLSAINGSSVSDCASLLSAIYAFDQSAYSSIIISLSSMADKNQAIYDLLNTQIPTILSSIQTLTNVQVQYNATMLQMIHDYIYGTADSTEGQVAMSQAGNNLESAGHALDYSKPNQNDVIGVGDMLLTPDVQDAQSSIFVFLSNPYVLTILIFLFGVSIMSYVLYGKSG